MDDDTRRIRRRLERAVDGRLPAVGWLDGRRFDDQRRGLPLRRARYARLNARFREACRLAARRSAATDSHSRRLISRLRCELVRLLDEINQSDSRFCDRRC